MLAGAAIYYRTQIQPVIALSSTESELYAMVDAGKAALYLRSILKELGLEQTTPTTLYADNRGARCLANAQQPTRRTRHVDIKQFVILQWTEDETITYVDIPTQHNISDSLSKPVGRIKFYEQNDILMVRRTPAYTSHDNTYTINTSSTYRIFRFYKCGEV